MLNINDKIQLRTDLLHIGEIIGLNFEDKLYTIMFNGIKFPISEIAFDNLMRKAVVEHVKPKENKPIVQVIKAIIKKDIKKEKKVKKGK